MSGAFEAADRAREEAEAMVERSREQVREALDEVAGGPASNVREAEQQVASLRSRLDRDVAALRHRLPEPQELARRGGPIGAVAAGGVVALAAGVVVLRRRSARKAQDEQVRVQAIALANELRRLERETSEEGTVEPDTSGRGGRLAFLALVAAGVGVAVWARRRRDPVDLEEGIHEELAATPDVEGGMVDLSGTTER